MNVERFSLGRTQITSGAQNLVPQHDVIVAINRHAAGDWGNVCAEDAAQNEWAMENDARLISSYETDGGVEFWLITEADRSATTILLPEEY